MSTYYNAKVLEIWEGHTEEECPLPGMNLFPMQRTNLRDNPDILFIGMNPSFSKSIQKGVVAQTYKWHKHADQQHLNRLAELEDEAQKDYKIYFNAIKNFASDAASENFEHLDLLPVRHTSQTEVVKSFWDKQGDPLKITTQCMEIFKETLLKINPKTVVIANAGAANKIIKLLDLQRQDNRRSYRWTSCNRMSQTPFFLSGMLSGQRALDNFSKDRLIADVRAALHPNIQK
jgi:hypothetical protein